MIIFEKSNFTWYSMIFFGNKNKFVFSYDRKIVLDNINIRQLHIFIVPSSLQ